MKTIYFFLLVLLQGLSLFAQSPQALNYQAIARDNSGNPLSSQQISLQISILTGSITGMTVYVETHAITTDDRGLFTLHIGRGTAGMGLFADIDWGADAHFVQVELDPSGGSNYQLLGTSELLSVPYALYAEHTAPENGSGAGAEVPISSLDNGFNDVILIETPLVSQHYATAIDPSGYVFVASIFTNTIQVGGTSVTANDTLLTPGGLITHDFYVAKFDWNGNLEWVKSGGSTTEGDTPFELHANNGEVIVLGQFGPDFLEDSLTFGGIQYPLAVGKEFVMKLDALGNVDWLTLADYSPSSPSLSFQSSAWEPGIGVGVGGYFTGQVSLGSTTLTASGTDADAFVGLLDESTGAYLWATAQGTSGKDEQMADLSISDQGVIYTSLEEFFLTTFAPPFSSTWQSYSSTGTLGVERSWPTSLPPSLLVGNSELYAIHSPVNNLTYLHHIDPTDLSSVDSTELIGAMNIEASYIDDTDVLQAMFTSGSNYLINDVLYRPFGSVLEPFMTSYDAMNQVSLQRRLIIDGVNTQGQSKILNVHTDAGDTRVLGDISGYFFNDGDLYTTGLYLLRW